MVRHKISVILSDNLFKKLVKRAKANERTVSQEVRVLIKECIK